MSNHHFHRSAGPFTILLFYYFISTRFQAEVFASRVAKHECRTTIVIGWPDSPRVFCCISDTNLACRLTFLHVGQTYPHVSKPQLGGIHHKFKEQEFTFKPPPASTTKCPRTSWIPPQSLHRKPYDSCLDYKQICNSLLFAAVQMKARPLCSKRVPLQNVARTAQMFTDVSAAEARLLQSPHVSHMYGHTYRQMPYHKPV